MPSEERLEANELEIIKLRDTTFSTYYDIDILSKTRSWLIQNKYGLSFAWIIFKTIQGIDTSILMTYNKSNVKRYSAYRRLFQYEWDEIFEVCINANKLGLTIFPNINTNNDLNYLNSTEQMKLLEVYSDALNKYFDIMIRYNKVYLDEEGKFMSKMLKFGNNHGMNEEDLVIFANKALLIGINIANINTQEELDEAYKKVYPEA